MIQASQHPPYSISADSCPFCEEWEKTLRETNPIPLRETLVVTLEQFMKHVGSHMVQLALFALPRVYDDDQNAGSNAAAIDVDTDKSSNMDKLSSNDDDSILEGQLPARKRWRKVLFFLRILIRWQVHDAWATQNKNWRKAVLVAQATIRFKSKTNWRVYAPEQTEYERRYFARRKWRKVLFMVRPVARFRTMGRIRRRRRRWPAARR